MIRVGAVAFVVGAAFTLIAMSQLLTGAELPSAVWFLSMLMGVGFALILFGLLRNARRRGAQVRRTGAARTDEI